MCVPQGVASSSSKEGKFTREHRHVPFDKKVRAPDPNFVDERKKKSNEPKKSFLSYFFGKK